MKFAAILKTERNEYAKQIRKSYESHKVSARRCELKQITIRNDGLCNTITTINKDNLVIQSVG